MAITPDLYADPQNPALPRANKLRVHVSAPADPTSAVEMPLPVKRHLGLDDDPSWIVVEPEGNEFLWRLASKPPAPRHAARMNNSGRYAAIR